MSCGPGEASGWPWKQNAGLSVRARPCSVPSNRLTWVARRLAGSVFSSTAKPWFWLVMLHAAVVQVLHRVVGAVVAELHLEGLGAGGQRHDLVAQADAEGGIAVLDQFARRLDRVVAGLRVAGAVGQEHAVGLELPHFGRRRLRRHHGDLAAALGQHAQDVLLHAVVEGDDVVLRRAPARRSRRPAATRSGPSRRAAGPRRPWPGRGPLIVGAPARLGHGLVDQRPA